MRAINVPANAAARPFRGEERLCDPGEGIRAHADAGILHREPESPPSGSTVRYTGWPRGLASTAFFTSAVST